MGDPWCQTAKMRGKLCLYKRASTDSVLLQHGIVSFVSSLAYSQERAVSKRMAVPMASLEIMAREGPRLDDKGMK